jgi:type I restriction enzyme S subunit
LDQDVEAVSSNFIARVRPRSDRDSRFVVYLMAALYLSRYSHQFIKQNTGIQNLDDYALFDTKVWLPALNTQKSIANFLDRETARIDYLIEKKEQQRLLLAEKARATVIDAVTRGLHQGVPMQSTGLDWLPLAPAHWHVTRIANLFCEANEPGVDGLPILSVSIHHGISDRELDEDERDRKAMHIEDRTSYQRVRPGYLAYNMMRAWQGAVGVSTVDGLVSPAYVVAKPKVEIHTPFFQYLLRTPACIEEMRRGSKGIVSFRLRLYWENFRQIVVVLPPPPEQKEIAELANQTVTRAAQVGEVVKQSVERLREHRAALIIAAVTGQIDLTSWGKQGNTDRLDATLETLG